MSPEQAGSKSKYTPENLIPIFRKAAKFRDEMIGLGFTDNGGAIHSAERILDILGQRLKYPGLTHINNLDQHQDAEFSLAAFEIWKRGDRRSLKIEHVAPQRAFTREAIDLLRDGATDQAFTDYVRQHYRVVLLTAEEMAHLNKINRSRMTSDRLGGAGIKTVCRTP